MSQAFRAREPARRTLLSRVPLTETMLERLHETGRLDVMFSAQAGASRVTSLDGSGAVLVLGASGQPVQLTLDDFVDPEEDRHVHFAAFTISLRWRDEELLVHASPGILMHDPWLVPSTPSRSAVIRAGFRPR